MSDILRPLFLSGCITLLLAGCLDQVDRVDTTRSNKSEDALNPTASGWEKIGPGGGGATFIPTFAYQNPAEFLLRCDMTGSYLTQDGGRSYQQINFPNGASSYGFDPSDSSIIYIGSAVLNQSKDGGKTWSVLFPKKNEIRSEQFIGDHANFELHPVPGSLYDSTSGSISNIRVDPDTSASLYFSMGNFFFYSNDQGLSWQKKDCHSPIGYIYTNRFSLKNEVLIFTARDRFSFNKTSKLFSDKHLPLTIAPAFSFAGGVLASTKSTWLYALHHDQTKKIENEFGHTELWISEDAGINWRAATDSVIKNNSAGIKPSFSMIACAEFDAANAYLITNRYEQKNDTGFIYWYGALNTKDRGNTWDWVWRGGGGSGQYGVKDGKGVANLKDAWSEKAFGGEYIRLMDVGVAPGDGKIAVVTDWYRSMKTLDGGKTWKEIYSQEVKDGSFTSRGLDVTTAYGVHFDPFDSNHIAISYTDIGYHHSYDRGKSWTRSTTGVPAEWINTCYWVVFDPGVKNRLWSAWSGIHDFPRGKMTRNPAWKQFAKGGVCVSNDGGKSWSPLNTGMGFDSPVTSLVLEPKTPVDHRTIYASVYSKGVFKSTDDGKTWTLKNKGIDTNTCAFELTLTPRGTLFLTVSATPAHKNGKKGRDFFSGAVYRSIDGAENWEKLQVADGPIFPNGIEYDRTNPAKIYLACWSTIDLSDLVGAETASGTGGNVKIKMPGGIFMSEDNGSSWRSIFDQQQYVYDVTADPYHEGRLYCNTFNQAAYRSNDSGKTWQKIKGYDFHWGQRAIVDQNNPDKIYLTTFGSSVWHGRPMTNP